jgi:hypothetical protein
MSSAAAASKRSSAAAEAGAVEKVAKAPTRKRTTRARTTPKAPAPPRRSRPAIAFVVLLAIAAAAAVALSAVRDDGSKAEPAAVSQDDLVALAGAEGMPVYWAGPIAGRELELTTSADGTFVRYLPPGARAGDARLALTVATYAVADAFATAEARAKGEGMIARETRNGGLAVWSREQPTSVYVAFAGVPQLVEVYAPDAAEARALALSGRIRPVR